MSKSFYYEGERCILELGSYADGCPAIQVRGEDGTPIAKLTVWLIDRQPKAGEFFVKTWSENSEIAKAILEAGLMYDTNIRIPSGYVSVQVWKMKE